MRLNGKVPVDCITLLAGEDYTAAVDIFEHDNDPLTYRWELKRESETAQSGGDFEEAISNLPGLIHDDGSAEIRITAPDSGTYRLFVYAYDGEGHAAHANIPFLVSTGANE
jgi:hypothetical protein